jgi:hypothetical protein
MIMTDDKKDTNDIEKINVKKIRKAAEILGMKPQDLIDKYDIDEYKKIIENEIKLDFEEKVERLLKLINSSDVKLQQITSAREKEISFLQKILGYLVFLFVFFTIILLVLIPPFANYVAILFIGIIYITIIVCALILFFQINKMTYNNKSPQRYAVEEVVKIIELIEKQEKY